MNCWSCRRTREAAARRSAAAAGSSSRSAGPTTTSRPRPPPPVRRWTAPSWSTASGDLSRQLHPDRFARAEARERRISLERATRLNDALPVPEGLAPPRRVPPEARRDRRLRRGQDLRRPRVPRGAARVARGRWRSRSPTATAPRCARIAERRHGRLAALEAEVGELFEDQHWFSELIGGDRAPALAGALLRQHRRRRAARGRRRPSPEGQRHAPRHRASISGTTNSLVAHVDERNRPQVLPVDEGRPLLPSAVFYGAGRRGGGGRGREAPRAGAPRGHGPLREAVHGAGAGGRPTGGSRHLPLRRVGHGGEARGRRAAHAR